ncbi:FG-GAP repeat domain-containing protein [Streptomyces sp. NPDC127084]|uniref:FG-GAP repeat domain-containing protein n=1 Tax=Streptomyces sp. NPDC127084 TaxID=3347133 RepID=UPI003646DDA0
MRRALGAGVAVVMAATGGVLGTGTAHAAGDPTYYFDPLEDAVLMPGEGYVGVAPTGSGGSHDGRPDGTWVYALSKKELKSGAWTGGLPSGLKADWSQFPSCKPQARITGVYLCDVNDSGDSPGPEVSAAANAAHGLTAYVGLVYVPRGADLDKGIKEAQTAASRPVDGRHTHASIAVKSRAHVALNTMKPATATLPAGGSVKHTVKLHAVDKGKLNISFPPAPGFRGWDEGELKVQVDSITSNDPAGAECDHSLGEIGWGSEARCDVKKPGDYTVTYTLKAAATAPAWKLRAEMTYDVYNYGTFNPEARSDFGISSSVPVIQRYRLVGRDAEGGLWDYKGTGKARSLFDPVDPVGWDGDWNRYSAITRLGPITVQSSGPGAVARDKAGVLWFYRTSGDGGIYKTRLKVGSGWQIYNSLTGAADLTGDKKADLLARDASGVLWLYPGTGNTAAPFGVRTKIGAGWGVYNSLAGGTDVTGDGRADLVARDTAGKQWLYAGTGTAAKPFGGRVQVGTSWQIYNSVVAPGDLNSDGRADLVARDKTGVLWYYKGTGVAAKPYAARVKVSGGWQRFNLLF